jgi:hypothetical protein
MPTPRILVPVLAGSAMLSLFGCTHPMTVTNLGQYSLPPTHARQLKVAVLPYQGRADGKLFFEEVLGALLVHPAVAELRDDWRWDAHEPGFEPDVVVSIEPRARYRGSGWNFPITWPGFLLFTHAWNGYVFHADVHADIQIYDPDTRELATPSQLEVTYSMRYCDFERGALASSAWWMPPYTATALVAGLFFIRYDKDATQPFHNRIRKPFGDYVAERVMRPALEFARAREPRRGADAAEIEAPAGQPTPSSDAPHTGEAPESGTE